MYYIIGIWIAMIIVLFAKIFNDRKKELQSKQSIIEDVYEIMNKEEESEW